MNNVWFGSLAAIVSVGGVSLGLVAGSGGTQADSGPPEAAVHAFIDAFERASTSDVAATLTEDAMMFAPFVPERIEGREAIAATIDAVFSRLRQRGDGPRYLTLDPVDLHVRESGSGSVAVVTWHFRHATEIGRRTAVLQRTASGWKIASFHASTFARSEDAAIRGAPPTQTVGLPRLDEYDWTRWLVGEWEGWFEDPAGNRTVQRQTFEFVAGQRHVLTRLRMGEGEGAYHGVGVFSYDPARGLSSAEWFGMLGDRNYGLGRRTGDEWRWDIHRHGRQRVLRVRERISDDEYLVTSTSTDDAGQERVTRERLRRVR